MGLPSLGILGWLSHHVERPALAEAVLELSPTAARALVVAADSRERPERKGTRWRGDDRSVAVPGQASFDRFHQLLRDLANRGMDDAVGEWLLAVLREPDGVLASQRSVLLVESRVDVRPSVLIREGKDEIGSTERVALLILEDHATPPVFERHGWMQAVGRGTKDGWAVVGAAGVEAKLHDAKSEGDDVCTRRRLRRPAIHPAELILNAKVRQETGRTARVVHQGPDRHGEPLRLMLLARVVGSDGRLKEVKLLEQVRLEVLHRAGLFRGGSYAAT